MKKIRTATVVLFMLSMISLAGCSNFLDNAKNINPADAVETAKNKLALGFASGDSAPAVTHSLTLATTGDDGVSISWISSNTSVVSNAGAVTRPAFGQPDAVVTLTATITKGAITETKTFEIHVAAYPDSSHADVLAAKDSLVLVFSGDDTADSVTEKLTLTSAGANGVAISWATSDAAFVGTAGHVTRPGTGHPDAVVTLTATITKGTETETKTFTVTVKAQPYRYTVAYDGNGNTQGAAPTDLNSYLANADVTAAAQGDLLKTGYSFVNWNTRSDGTGTDYAPSASFQMPGESLILYAKWTAKTYTVTFNAQGGTAASPASTVVTYASTYGALATTTRTGYSFDGWYTVSGGTGTQIKASSPVNITANQTLYAKWTANANTAYGVQHYQQDVSGSGYTLHETESLSGTTGATATAVAKSYTGFSENTGHASRVASGTIAGDGSLMLKLYYDRSIYTVSYSSNGGTAVSSTIGVRYGATISAPTAPTKTGYSFGGWYKEAGLTNAWIFASDTVTTATTLYAKWTASSGIAYGVQHYQQDVSGSGYTLHETESLSGTTGATATAVAKSYTGFSENTGHASRVASGTIAGDGSLVLKLYYDRSIYTVSYSSNGGTAVSPTIGVRYGATISAPTAPTKTGYSFGGWYKEASLTNAWTFASDTVTAATTLYAKWTANTYTVTFDAQAGTAASPASKLVTYASTYGALATTTRTGYALSGWYTGAGGTGTNITASSAVAITANQTLYAFWTALPTYTVTYSDNSSGSGTAPSDANSYYAGTTVTVLGNTGSLYKWGGYYFDGWNTNASGTGTDYAVGATLSIQGNLTLYAKWTKYVVTKHVVIFRDAGSEWNQPTLYGDLLKDEIGMSEGSGIAQYEYKTSADIPTYTPTVGDVLVVAASQPGAFYDAYRTDKAKFDSFVNAGGFMFWVYADCGNPWGKYDSTLPGGVVKNYATFEYYNDIVDNVHPITAGFPLGNFHGVYGTGTSGFSNLDDLVTAGTISNVKKLTVQSNDRLPTLVEYTYGSGKVIATTLVLDFYTAIYWTWPFRTIAINSLKYLLGLI